MCTLLKSFPIIVLFKGFSKKVVFTNLLFIDLTPKIEKNDSK